jgi:hypothetical protein
MVRCGHGGTKTPVLRVTITVGRDELWRQARWPARWYGWRLEGKEEEETGRKKREKKEVYDHDGLPARRRWYKQKNTRL